MAGVVQPGRIVESIDLGQVQPSRGDMVVAIHAKRRNSPSPQLKELTPVKHLREQIRGRLTRLMKQLTAASEVVSKETTSDRTRCSFHKDFTA